MALVKVASLSALPPGSVIEAQVGEESYAVCNLDGELHALYGICPHAGGPLGQGTLEGSHLVCPWHAWEYDCRTGRNDYDEEVVVRKFPVTVQGDDVLLEIP